MKTWVQQIGIVGLKCKVKSFPSKNRRQEESLTKLNSSRIFWQFLKCYIWKWHIGQFFNSATKKLYKFFLLNERPCPPRGGGSSFARLFYYGENELKKGGKPAGLRKRISTIFWYHDLKIDQYFIFKYYISNVTKILQI